MHSLTKTKVIPFTTSEQKDNSSAKDHAQSLLKYLQESWHNSHMCDFTIYCRNQQMKLHRVVLASQSKKFHEIFKSADPISYIIIDDVKEDAMRSIISYLYTGELITKNEYEGDLEEGAKLLGLHNLVMDKLDFCNINNVMEKLEICLKNNVYWEQQKCLKFISSFIPEVSHTVNFLKAPIDVLCNLLASDIIHENDEIEILRMVIRWLKFDARRRSETNRVLAYVQFPLIKLSDLRQELAKNCWITEICPKAKRYNNSALEIETTDEVYDFDDEYMPANKNKLQQPYLVAVYGHKIYGKVPTEFLIGKDDTGDTEWQEITVLPEFRNHPAVAYLDNYLYIIGGTDKMKNSTSIALRYHIEKDIWSRVSPMQESRSYASAAVIGDKIYVIGGKDTKRMLNSMEVYDPKHDKWLYASPASASCGAAAVTQYLDHIYRFGGDNAKKTLCLTEVYDPERDMWLLKAPLQEDVAFGAVVEIFGQLYLTGGAKYRKGYKPLSAIKIYHPMQDQWSYGGEMETRRCDHGIAKIGTKFYVFGGFQEYSKCIDTVECYDTRSGNMVQGTITSIPIEGPVITCTIPESEMY